MAADAPSAKRETVSTRIAESVDAITQRKLFQPQVAIVLGSGLGDLAFRVKHATQIPYGTIPHFPSTHAAGHAGQLWLGFLSGMPVVLMQGRAHRYEGRANSEVEFPIRCLHALGASTLITTNAAGGLNTRFQTGDLMVLDSHMDFLWERAPNAPSMDPHGVSPQRNGNPYDYSLIRRSREIAHKGGIDLHQGCYLATLGPTYETRSEYRMFRWMGADAVGMSTVPEVLAARSCGMNVLGFSVITNVASTDVPSSTTHQEVVDSGNQAGPKLMQIIQEILEDMAGQPD